MDKVITVDELPERTRKAKKSKFDKMIEEVRALAITSPGKWCLLPVEYGNTSTAGRQASLLRKDYRGIAFEWREANEKGVLYAKA